MTYNTILICELIEDNLNVSSVNPSNNPEVELLLVLDASNEEAQISIPIITVKEMLSQLYPRKLR